MQARHFDSAASRDNMQDPRGTAVVTQLHARQVGHMKQDPRYGSPDIAERTEAQEEMVPEVQPLLFGQL